MTNIYPKINIKRVYDEPEQSDGLRLLADRLWPRGISKTEFLYDRWIKDVCPSTELRKAWHANLLNFEEFSEQYLGELEHQSSMLVWIAKQALNQKVTLLTAVKTPEYSHIPILKKAILHSFEERCSSLENTRSSPVCYE